MGSEKLEKPEKLEKIKYWVIDVDGTMTDGGVYYDEHGNETKKFCTKDAAGFFAARQAGMKTLILTGRECAATKRRMTELKADYLYQNVKDKRKFLSDFFQKHDIHKEEIAYIGDDLNDYEAMQLAGFIGCPKDSCKEILETAHYVSVKDGGCGAVRDVIEYVLRKLRKWDAAVKQIYYTGI